MKKTQEQLVLEQLMKKGYVSRNWCLARYIARLSGVIYTLKYLKGHKDLDGYWGRNLTNKQDGDYYYVLKSFIRENKNGSFTLINTK